MKSQRQFVLADCDAQGVLPLARELRFRGRPFEVKSHISNWKRTGAISELKRYAKYFGVALLYFFRRKDLGAIVGWQQFYALIFCFYCSLFSVKKTTVVIALNFTYKKKNGIFEKPYRWFMGKCVSPKYMDYLHVLSQGYAQAMHAEFGFPPERIIVSSFGVNDRFEELRNLPAPEGYRKNGYALAIGRSNRDYDFLINAWHGIDYPLVIISDTYKGSVDAENITLLTNVAGEESNPWIANCGLMVIPIDDGSICSGDTVLLTAMSLQRKTIVTVPSTLAEMYIEDGTDAAVSVKDPDVFRSTVQKVLSDDAYSQIGIHAREHYLNSFSLQSMGAKITHFLDAQN